MASFKDLLSKFKAPRSDKPDESEVKRVEEPPKAAKLLADIENFKQSREYQQLVDPSCLQWYSTVVEESKTLGLLFIIIDDLPNEGIWRVWLEEHEKRNPEGAAQLPVWIHAKFPQRVRSPWVRQRLVSSFHLKPEWGSIELTKVMVLLLYQAMVERPDVQNFVYLSESCLPLVPVAQLLHRIYAEPVRGKSWMRCSNKASNGYAQQLQFEVLLKAGLGREGVWKADQWLLLTRPLSLLLMRFLCSSSSSSPVQQLPSPVMPSDSSAEPLSASLPPSLPPSLPVVPLSVLERHSVFSLFHDVRASDEVFLPTLFALLLSPPSASALPVSPLSSSPFIHPLPVTYCDWSQGGKSPETFPSLSPALYRIATGTERREEWGGGCLFLRKIKIGGGERERREGGEEWGRLLWGEEKGGEIGERVMRYYEEAVGIGGERRGEGREEERERKRSKNDK